MDIGDNLSEIPSNTKGYTTDLIRLVDAVMTACDNYHLARMPENTTTNITNKHTFM